MKLLRKIVIGVMLLSGGGCWNVMAQDNFMQVDVSSASWIGVINTDGQECSVALIGGKWVLVSGECFTQSTLTFSVVAINNTQSGSLASKVLRSADNAVVLIELRDNILNDLMLHENVIPITFPNSLIENDVGRTLVYRSGAILSRKLYKRSDELYFYNQRNFVANALFEPMGAISTLQHSNSGQSVLIGISGNDSNNGLLYHNISYYSDWITSVTGIEGVSLYEINGYPAPNNFVVAENSVGHVKFTWADVDEDLSGLDMAYSLRINDQLIEMVDPGIQEYTWIPEDMDKATGLVATLRLEDINMEIPDGEAAEFTFNLTPFPASESFRVVENQYGHVLFQWDDYQTNDSDLEAELLYLLEINGEEIQVQQGKQQYIYQYGTADVNFDVNKASISLGVTGGYPISDKVEVDLELYAFPAPTLDINWQASTLGNIFIEWGGVNWGQTALEQGANKYYKLYVNDEFVKDVPYGTAETTYTYEISSSGPATVKLQAIAEQTNNNAVSEVAEIDVYLPAYQPEHLRVISQDGTQGQITFAWDYNQSEAGLLQAFSHQIKIGDHTYNNPAGSGFRYIYEFDNFHDPLPQQDEISVWAINNENEVITLPVFLQFDYPPIPLPIYLNTRRLSEDEIIFEWDYPSIAGIENEIQYTLTIDGEPQEGMERGKSFTYHFDHNNKSGTAVATLIAIAPNGLESKPIERVFSYDMSIQPPTEFIVEIVKKNNTESEAEVNMTWTDVSDNNALTYKLEVRRGDNQEVLWEETLESGLQAAIYHYNPVESEYWGPAIANMWAENSLGQKSKILQKEINLPIPSAGGLKHNWISGEELIFSWDDIHPSWMSAKQKDKLVYHVKVGSWHKSLNQGTGQVHYPLNTQLTYTSHYITFTVLVEDLSSGAKSLLEQSDEIKLPDRVVSETNNNNIYYAGLAVVGVAIPAISFYKGKLGTYKYWPIKWKKGAINEYLAEQRRIDQEILQIKAKRAEGAPMSAEEIEMIDLKNANKVRGREFIANCGKIVN